MLAILLHYTYFTFSMHFNLPLFTQALHSLQQNAPKIPATILCIEPQPTPEAVLPHPWLFVLNVVMVDKSEECCAHDIKDLWQQTIREHAADLIEIESAGLSWVIM